MASRYNLTQERKEKLKKEVLDEIDKISKSSSRKTILKVEKKIQPPVLKVVVKKPTETIDPKKNIITAVPIKKSLVKTTSRVATVVASTTKPVLKKKIKKIVQQTVKQNITQPPKYVKAPAPAVSPVSKKSRTRLSAADRIRERDLFFNPDSFVKPAISAPRRFKPQIKIGSKKMFIWGVIICLILGFILALAVNIFGIYRLNWNGPVSQKVIRVLPLPAGMVDGRIISLADYYNDLNIVQSVLTTSNSTPSPDNEKTKEQLFNRLVSVNIIENQLAKYGKPITQAQIDAEMVKVIEQLGSEAKAIEDIKSVYGMDIMTFKNNVLKPILAMDILNQLITTDETLAINQEAQKNAADALKIALQPDADFKTIVMQYSNDPSTLNQSGDLGWYSRGELTTEIEDPLFNLSDGQIYDKVVKDDYGYHIYKVESKLLDAETGKESIKISQIFITVDTELYIKSLFDKAIIKRFI